MGYQDGYCDGMVVLDVFKYSFVQQISVQVGQLVKNFDVEMKVLEGDMVQFVVCIVVELVCQVVCSELVQWFELIVWVVYDVVEVLQFLVCYVCVCVYFDDYFFVQDGVGNEMCVCEVQFVFDFEVLCGGVRVDVDVVSVDVMIVMCWQQVMVFIGQ